MKPIHRREFIKGSVYNAGGILAAPAVIRNLVKSSPNERINVAVVGISGVRPHVRGMINGRGIVHIRGYAQVPDVRVTAICDVDERLFPSVSAEVEKLYGAKPKAEIDMRRLLEDKDIDVVSIVTPDHWHALQTIWACQAGKDVFVEKPVSYNISEGRKMVQAARKYNRVVLGGMTHRFSRATTEGVKLIHEGKLGKVYMARAVTFKYRPTVGTVKDSPVPDGVHWDMFLGPAPYRPFNENRFQYGWHWFWDTSTTEFGNNGIYRVDVARWALKKDIHPVKVHCTGGLFGRQDDQEVPNILVAAYEYDDGMIIQNETRCLATNREGNSSNLTLIYGEEGWMAFSGNGYETYFGAKSESGPRLSDEEIPEEEQINGWKEFIGCIRSRQTRELRNDILEGHMSAALGHLGIISYRTGRKLTFNPEAEKFVNDAEADSYLTRNYRPPYLMPEKI